jgi:hypothetical protein
VQKYETISEKPTKSKRTGCMAQVVAHLPSKWEAFSSIPVPPKNSTPPIKKKKLKNPRAERTLGSGGIRQLQMELGSENDS